MEYADIAWPEAPFCLLTKLDHIVDEAMRLITGAPARYNIANLYKETGWKLVLKRCEIHFNDDVQNYKFHNICLIFSHLRLNRSPPPHTHTHTPTWKD